MFALHHAPGTQVAAAATSVSCERSYLSDQIGTEKTTALNASAGEAFAIVLQSNPSTGSHWQIAEPLTAGVVAFVGKAYKPSALSAGTPGSPVPVVVGLGGEDLWLFKALGPGSAAIVLDLIGPGSAGKTLQVQTFTVTVTPEPCA
jgi:predicted secreted protein